MSTGERVDVFSCTIEMHFQGQDVKGAMKLLQSAIGCTESKAGCFSCRISRDTLNENRILYSETWESEAAFKRHAGSEEFKRVLIALDMCSQEPIVRVGNFSGETGLNFLQELSKP